MCSVCILSWLILASKEGICYSDIFRVFFQWKAQCSFFINIVLLFSFSFYYILWLDYQLFKLNIVLWNYCFNGCYSLIIKMTKYCFTLQDPLLHTRLDESSKKYPAHHCKLWFGAKKLLKLTYLPFFKKKNITGVLSGFTTHHYIK